MTKNITIAIVAIAVVSLGILLMRKSSTQMATATSQCSSGQTCLASLELTGPNSGVTNALQVDAGKVLSTATTSVGASLLLTPTGAAAPSCIEFYATSTATKDKLVFVASTTPNTNSYLGVTYGSCTN